jgi:hypothetical protein
MCKESGSHEVVALPKVPKAWLRQKYDDILVETFN